METLWTRDINAPEHPSLSENITADVLTIGGGMAGVLTARELQNAGLDTVLLEASAIGSGVTSGTTAVVSAQHSTLYSELISKFGRDAASCYLKANL